jgi:hypothetical protein
MIVVAAVVALEVVFVVSAVSQTGCGLCHVPARSRDELAHSTHKGTECSACHEAPGVAGALRYNLQAADHFVGWLTGQHASWGGEANLVASSCPRCHQHLADRVVATNGVMMSHKQVMESSGSDTSTTSTPCTQCHAQVAHKASLGGVASLDPHTNCLGCHDGLTASKECSTCHVGAGSARLVSATALPTPHPSDWAGGHGMGDTSTCPLCHPSSYCKRCHDVSLPHDAVDYIYTHGKEASAGTEPCFACHIRSSCADCHKIPMPHDARYLQEHGADAQKRGADVCLGCHIADGCDNCHVKHIHPGVPKSVLDKLEATPVTPKGPSLRTPTTTAPGGP